MSIKWQRFSSALLSTLLLTACAGAPLPGLNGLPQQLRQNAPAAQIKSFSQPIRPIQTNLPKGKEPRQVTSFSYLALDNNLSQSAHKFLNAVEKSVNPKGYFLSYSDLEGPNNSFLSLLLNDTNPHLMTSPQSPLDVKTHGFVDEHNTSDPNTLAQTINWAFSNYPSRLNAMTVSTHGAGYLGLIEDDFVTQEGMPTFMSAESFGWALRQGLKGRKLHVLNLSACLMSNVEALYEIHDTTEVVLASEDSMLSSQDTEEFYITEFNRVLSQPGLTPQQIGKHMAIFGQAKNPNSGFYTLSAIDMRQIPQLKSQITLLSNALIRALPLHRPAIETAYNAVPGFELSDGMGQRDLWNFCNQLLAQVRDPQVQQTALGVKAQIKRTLIHHRDKEGARSNGFSIFMPDLINADNQWQKDIAFSRYPTSRFAKDSSWDQFIQLLIKR